MTTPALRGPELSTRVRITVTTVVLLAAALVAMGAGMALRYRRVQEHAVEQTAQAQAGAVVDLARQGPLPTVLPALAPGPFTLVQVVDADGRVVAATAGLEKAPPVVGIGQLGRRGRVEQSQLPFTSTPQRTLVETVPVVLDGRPATVLVVSSLADTHRGETTLLLNLLVGLPLVAMVGAILAWTAVGRALRPVEVMRRQADDITERRLHMRIAQPPGDDAIARLATTLNQMLERLDRSALQQRRFVADASHELRSPLTGIHAALDVAIGGEPDNRAFLERLLKENERLEKLVDQLLVLARVDEGRQIRREPIDLSALVGAEIRRVAIGGGPTVDVSLQRGVTVLGDRELLARVVTNLVSNAVRHAGSIVTVELTSDNGDVQLVVADDGPGISPADRERVFQRFVRLHDDRGRATGGAGLGLAIVHDAVVAHGGTIAIDDRQPGASFTVHLPR